MPTWRALAVSSAIGTPVVVSTYISVHNNFSNKKFLLPKQGKGVLWYTTTISDQSFFKSGSAKITKFRQTHQSISSDFVRPINQFHQISSDPSTNFIRPINQFRPTHQSISSNPSNSLELSISLEPSISSDPVQNSANPFKKKFISFQKFWIHLCQFFESVQNFNLGSA
jgi:hypothetical protein